MVVFSWKFDWKLGYNPSLLIPWMTCWGFWFKSYDLKQWSSTWAKSLPRGRFYDLQDLGGNFCSLSILNFWIDLKKQYLLLWSQSKWCTFYSIVSDKGYKIYRSGHATIKLSSFCVTLHCTNYPRTLRFSLVESQALRFSQRLWMWKYFVETNVQNKIKE